MSIVLCPVCDCMYVPNRLGCPQCNPPAKIITNKVHCPNCDSPYGVTHADGCMYDWSDWLMPNDDGVTIVRGDG